MLLVKKCQKCAGVITYAPVRGTNHILDSSPWLPRKRRRNLLWLSFMSDRKYHHRGTKAHMWEQMGEQGYFYLKLQFCSLEVCTWKSLFVDVHI